MVAAASLTPEVATADRLVELLRRDRFPLRAAALATDEDERWRLYIAPNRKPAKDLHDMLLVATTISRHAEAARDILDLLYSVVEENSPLLVELRRKISRKATLPAAAHGIFADGRFIETAWLLYAEGYLHS
jgi:hypothetical protein